MPEMPDNDRHWEVIVLGAGAAGLLAAIAAAECGRQVLVLEKNRKPGVKILMSGGTRCNLTHNTDARGIIEAYGDAGRFLHSALAKLDPRGVIELFQAEGVEVKIEETGKIFPVSDSAVDVQQALLRRVGRSGARLSAGEAATAISKETDDYLIETPSRSLRCRRLIITTGGKSYPGCGTTGDGYAWAEIFGHQIIPPRPALTPLLVDEEWVKGLQGLTIPDAEVGIRIQPEIEADAPSALRRCARGRLGKDKFLARRRASLLFTHLGLSGPAALDVSRAVTTYPKPRLLELVCDFLPAQAAEAIETQWTQEAAREGARLLVNLLSTHVPRRLAETLMTRAKIPLELRAAEWSKPLRKALIAQIKASRIPLAGTLGFEKAEVTTGGVDLSEVNSKTMESRKVKGLYFAGEILDLDGPIGGYNFQAAFSTGLLAGMSAAESLAGSPAD
jgi:predicted Rossmann fold flavoprotein